MTIKVSKTLLLEALVGVEEKLLAPQELDDFDREILAIIAPVINAARGVRKSHSADLKSDARDMTDLHGVLP